MKAVEISYYKWNYLKDDGSYLFDEHVQYCWDFSEELGVIQYKDEEWNYVKNDGTLLFNKNVKSCNSFSNGYGVVNISGNRWNYVNINGEFQYDNHIECNGIISFEHDTSIVVLESGKIYCINTDFLESKKYDDCYILNTDTAAVKLNSIYKLINTIDYDFINKDTEYKKICSDNGIITVMYNDNTYNFLDTDYKNKLKNNVIDTNTFKGKYTYVSYKRNKYFFIDKGGKRKNNNTYNAIYRLDNKYYVNINNSEYNIYDFNLNQKLKKNVKKCYVYQDIICTHVLEKKYNSKTRIKETIMKDNSFTAAHNSLYELEIIRENYSYIDVYTKNFANNTEYAISETKCLNSENTHLNIDRSGQHFILLNIDNKIYCIDNDFNFYTNESNLNISKNKKIILFKKLYTDYPNIRTELINIIQEYTYHNIEEYFI